MKACQTTYIMYICSFTELKIHKFKNVNSFLGFLGSLSSWSLLFSVWKMNLEHWNYGLSFIWTLITVLFISTYSPGILRILNTFDSWIIKIKIIGDLKDIYFICKNKTSVFHYFLVLKGMPSCTRPPPWPTIWRSWSQCSDHPKLMTTYLDCVTAATARDRSLRPGRVVMSMLRLCLPYV